MLKLPPDEDRFTSALTHTHSILSCLELRHYASMTECAGGVSEPDDPFSACSPPSPCPPTPTHATPPLSFPLPPSLCAPAGCWSRSAWSASRAAPGCTTSSTCWPLPSSQRHGHTRLLALPIPLPPILQFHNPCFLATAVTLLLRRMQQRFLSAAMSTAMAVAGAMTMTVTMLCAMAQETAQRGSRPHATRLR